MEIPKATPEEVFKYLEAVSSLEEASIEQIRSKLKTQWPPVRNAHTFCKHFKLISLSGKKIKLAEVSERMLQFTDQKRIDFIKSSGMLLREPFNYLVKEIESNVTINKEKELFDILKVKFLLKSDKSESDKIASSYKEWLLLLGYLKEEGNSLVYCGGKVKTENIFSLKEFEYLQERQLKHILIEEFDGVNKIIRDCSELLEKVENEKDDNKRGKLFQNFVALVFCAFGFVPRTKNSQLEKDLMIFSDNKGGGDVTLFNHFPINSDSRLFEGGILCCEAKSTKGNIGSNAVGQARNLNKKVKLKYPKYISRSIIVSRSTSGLDPSGISLAPPEVIHIKESCLMELLKIQKSRLNSANYLIIPSEFFRFVEELIKGQDLQPSLVSIKDFFDR